MAITTALQIANRALAKLSGGTITALDTTNRTSTLLTNNIDNAIEYVLWMDEWKWAVQIAELTTEDSDNIDWAYEVDTLPAATAEVITLTFSGTAAGSGTLPVVIRGTTTNIAITDGMLPASAAAAVEAQTYTGWTDTASGSVVTFTASVAEQKQGDVSATLPAAVTGMTATIEVTTVGKNAMLRPLALVGDGDYLIEAQTLYCNEENPDLKYIKNFTSSQSFAGIPIHLADAIACRLAADVAYELTGKAELHAKMEQMFEAALLRARQFNALGYTSKPEVEDLWTEVV